MSKPRPETVAFVEMVLTSHSQVVSWEALGDFRYRVKRRYGDELELLLEDVYIIGVSDVLEARQHLPNVRILVTGSVWNQVSVEADDFAKKNGMIACTGADLARALAQKDLTKFKARPW